MTTSKPTTKVTGDLAESIAAEYLIGQGYRVLEKNFHAGHAEIDLIVEKDSMLVFVEVKARQNITFARPESAVNTAKRRQIIKAAFRFLTIHQRMDSDSRFDIVAVTLTRPPQVEHFSAAFYATPEDLRALRI